ncbi:MAG: alkaline phosphatase family protein [Opitutaceae bacterium]|nr:alkaline phosphatase family protein [Opitutaceae bacterium]
MTPPTTPTPISGRKALVIGWDGADWQIIKPLLAAGRLPHLQRLLGQGVAANLTTLQPIFSPLLWTSAATGKRPTEHGILGFTEPDPDPLGTGVRLSTSTTRQGKAFWNILSQVGLRVHTVGWMASHPAEPINGIAISDLYEKPCGALDEPWPLPPGTVHPPELASELAELRVHPGEISLNDLRPFVPSLDTFDPATEPALGLLTTRLAEAASIHVAATYILENHPWDCLAVLYPTLDHICHNFIDCHPPRLPHLSEEKFERFRHVINATYELHDQMLGTLLAHTDDDTAIILVSDHGFYSDHLRPAYAPTEYPGGAITHRPVGILALRAPGCRAGEWIFGANLIDLTPTLLSVFGLPFGRDMSGRPWSQAFARPLPLTTIPTWETVSGPHSSGQHPPDLRVDPVTARAGLRQLVDLGYMAEPSADAETAAADCALELRYNRALCLLFENRPAEALPGLEEMCAARPHRTTAHLHRISALQGMGRLDEALVAIADLERPDHPARLRLASQGAGYSPRFDLMRGLIAFQQNRPHDALAHLERARADSARNGEMHLLLGRVYMKLRRWADAEAAYTQALALDPDHPEARVGHATALYRLRRWPEAAEQAIAAAELNPGHFLAHYVLGLALARQGQRDHALFALRATVAAAPGFAPAHRVLAWLLRRDPAQRLAADLHRRASRGGQA